jgi:uncharacterized protein YegP (UPF0339 family)
MASFVNSNMIFEIYKGKGRNPWYVRVIAPNNQVILTTEGYFSKWNAKRAVRRMFGDVEIRYIL